MKALPWFWSIPLIAAVGLWPTTSVPAGPKPDAYWNVDEVRPGMKGQGRTVLRGTKVEKFDAEVLGVLKNTSPGRDLVLCRLSGLNLDHTGVIAGMSGSPIYLDGKLLGAVAYAWPYGKEPIAGITPFSQMHAYVEAYERRDLAEQGQPNRVGLRTPVTMDGKEVDAVTVSDRFDEATTTAAGGVWMVPLQTPLAATGFTPHSLSLLRDRCRSFGLLPVQGGAVGEVIVNKEKNTKLEPGGPLAVAMITGDFDLSGMGTVTHIEGSRIYGWGHPFFGLGRCDFPAMTGYIHTVCPRLSVSFKLGSPLRAVGVINADVSTGVAGWLDRKADLMPVRMNIRRGPNEPPRSFNVQIARQRSLLATLVYTALTNSVDMEGELPEELTADLQVRIEVEDQPPILLKDTFSGMAFTGARAPQALYNQVATILSILTHNTYRPLRINRIECETVIQPGRRTADIEAVELDSDTYSPGETVRATVFLRPYRGARQRVAVELKLPADVPEGGYTATVCDDVTNARHAMRENPILGNPQTLPQLYETLRVQTEAKRTNLVVRVPLPGAGVAVGGQALPNLPPGMVQLLGSSRKTGALTLSGAVVARQPTAWVIQGSDQVRFTVVSHKRTLSP